MQCSQNTYVLLEIVYRDVNSDQDTNPPSQYLSRLRLYVQVVMPLGSAIVK
jgi:hypothetical protein